MYAKPQSDRNGLTIFFPGIVTLRGGRRVATRVNSSDNLGPHCVNIRWDTSDSEFSVEFMGEEEHHGDHQKPGAIDS